MLKYKNRLDSLGVKEQVRSIEHGEDGTKPDNIRDTAEMENVSKLATATKNCEVHFRMQASDLWHKF